MKRPVFLILFSVLFLTAASAAHFRNEHHLISDVSALIQRNYVEEVPPKKLLTGALNGMLTSLDPYSQLLSRDAYQELEEDTHGEFGGIGIEVAMRDGLLRVIAPLDGSPAERAGLRSGDAIIKIDGVPAHDMTLNDAVKKMKGVPGSVIRLSLMREPENKVVDIPVTREIIKIKSVKEAKLLEGRIGYIRFSAFQENSAKELEQAIRSLESQGMQGLILDIRNNAGGLLTAAVEVAGKFIPEGRLIVSTKGRNPGKNIRYFSGSGHVFSIQPLVILVNQGSASSSEILAGAIQDHRLGTVIGTKTFGKGSVQSLIPLGDGTAIRMTTSRYCTPGGRLIHEKGIVPDLVVEAGGEKEKDIQLEKAVAWIQGEGIRK